MKKIMMCVLVLVGACVADVGPPSTSKVDQKTVGVCTDVPLTPGSGDPQTQCPSPSLYQITYDYSYEIATQVSYLGPIDIGCSDTAHTCLTRLVLGLGEWIDVTCDRAGCGTSHCYGDPTSGGDCTPL